MAQEELAKRLRSLFTGGNISERSMFGARCFMLDGHMLVCASNEGLLVRVGKDVHAAALAMPHVRPMAMGGRTMAGYVIVADAGTTTAAQLRAWVDTARKVVATLPPKPKTSASRRA